MKKLLAGASGLLLTVLLGACAAVNTSGLGEAAGNATLPSGARLLDSEQAECDGMVQVDPDTLEGEGASLDDMDDDDMDDADSEFFVESGQNAVFELDDDGDDDVGWTCVGEDGDADSHTMNCPDGTDYVRVTRADDGDDILLECFSS